MKRFLSGIMAVVIITVSSCLTGLAADITDNWTISGDASVVGGTVTVSGTARVSQELSGLENGTYNLSVTAKTSNIDGIAYVYAKTAGHTMSSTSIPQTSAAQTVVVPNVIVDNGKCEIGVYAQGSATVTVSNFSLSKTEETRVPFLKGGEISKLTYVEDKGGKFYRADGSEADALQIMAENGFNLARIRVLNNPGKGHGNGTYYLPEDYQTEEDCLSLARRAKDKGMKILFSFAYSDYWSDGGEQFIPHDWQEEITEQNLNGEDLYQYLENKTYEYTKDIMQKLIAQGTCPEYVSIGNEMQYGLYFGRWQDKSPMYNNADMIARFVNAGAKAVRETSPETKVVLHSDNGGKLSKRGTFKSLLSKADYDVIGVSYYPFYNADVSIDTVVSEFNSLISTYNKDVIIMETGYNWNELRGDGWEGQLHDSGYYQNIYGETQEGQRAFLTELYTKLKRVAGGRCIGDLYWDPIMLYDGGNYTIGWAQAEDGDWTQGNEVSNSNLFDFDSKAVEGQLAMKYNTNSTDKLNITGKVTDGTKNITETQITFNVNGSKYNTTTDKFGEYIVSVPYPADGSLIISAKGCTEKRTEAAPSDGVLLRGINFVTYNAQATPDDFFVNGIIDVGGDINFEVDYTENVKNPLVYVALYDTSDNLIGCKKGREGTFGKPAQNGTYKLRAFLWKDIIEPVRTPAEAQIEYN